MKFTRTRDRDLGCPCWRLETRLLVIDADWNVRHRIPVGACLGICSPEQPAHDALKRWCWCLDVNAPLGEPNRLYLTIGARRGVRMILALWPGDGCDRYAYEHDGYGGWHRKPKPEPLHWGWLTISRRS